MAHKEVLNIAKQYQGMAGGAENGRRGYLLTYLIAYIRDFAMEYCIIAESFETSCPWNKVSDLCRKVEKRMRDDSLRCGFPANATWCSFRVTQLYETGAAVYVYLALNFKNFKGGKEKLVDIYEEIENGARDEVFKCGGCISHHHGVGKIRKRFMEKTMPDMAQEWNKKIKDTIDPSNIFGINNTFIRSEEERNEIFSKP